MGTLVHIGASGPNSVAIERAIESAFSAIDQVDRLMSFHNPNSELSNLNRHAHLGAITVHPWTYSVLTRAQQLARLSEGVFDVSVAPVLVAAGFLPNMGHCTARGSNWTVVQLLGNCQVFFKEPVLLDLGGIAKGFAVDQAIHALRRSGCTEAVVNAGGDLRRYGKNSHPVYLRRDEELLQVAELRCGAVATSSVYTQTLDRIAQPLGCIVNPIDGEPWRGSGSVMVAAKNCMTADALTKVAALVGPTCQPLLDRFGAQAFFDRVA